MTPDTLQAPAHLPPQCTTMLLSVPLADLAYALVVRLVQAPDIDPRDHHHLHRLQHALAQVSGDVGEERLAGDVGLPT